jgi:hypothetical protein
MRPTLIALVLAASLLTSTAVLFPSFWSGSAESKEGCGWDPYGLNSCTPSPPTEEGCGMDPWGADSCTPSQQP